MTSLLKIKKDPTLWQKYFIREKVIRLIREFFVLNMFHEVETPLLVNSLIPESYLDNFSTILKNRYGKTKQMFLTASPEASLKKLLTAGIGNCFEITKSFRNGETHSSLHNSEFTILEWYRVGATYKNVMRDCEELVMYILNKLKDQSSKIKTETQSLELKDQELIYQGIKINLASPWERISVSRALEKYAGVSFDEITDKNAKNEDQIFSVSRISIVARKKGYTVSPDNSWEEIFNQIYLNEIEPEFKNSAKPLIIYDFPKPLAALAKIKEDDKRLVERFEFYIAGLEIGDCYSELTDYLEQKQRFEKEAELIKTKNKAAVKIDRDFLDALKLGLPECAGCAVGIDRLVMLFTNSNSIKDVILFPI
jgi:lysyl-tRNA synthetase class 2